MVPSLRRWRETSARCRLSGSPSTRARPSGGSSSSATRRRRSSQGSRRPTASSGTARPPYEAARSRTTTGPSKPSSRWAPAAAAVSRRQRRAHPYLCPQACVRLTPPSSPCPPVHPSASGLPHAPEPAWHGRHAQVLHRSERARLVRAWLPPSPREGAATLLSCCPHSPLPAAARAVCSQSQPPGGLSLSHLCSLGPTTTRAATR